MKRAPLEHALRKVPEFDDMIEGHGFRISSVSHHLGHSKEVLGDVYVRLNERHLLKALSAQSKEARVYALCSDGTFLSCVP